MNFPARQPDTALPEESRGDLLRLDQLAAAPVRAGIAAWESLRRGRRYPARHDLAPVCLAPILPNLILVEVIEDGADYEYRFAGDALIAGFNEDFTGRRLSSIIETAPKFGLGLRMIYEMVRASGDPLGCRGWVGQDLPGAQFVYHENAVLPLGSGDTSVDHIMVVSHIVPRHIQDLSQSA